MMYVDFNLIRVGRAHLPSASVSKTLRRPRPVSPCPIASGPNFLEAGEATIAIS